MKTISILTVMAIFLLATISISSCKKDNTPATKQARLKTYSYRNAAQESSYTIDYNAAGKISTVQFFLNGALYSTKTCVYKTGNVLDSIIEKYVAGGDTKNKIGWTGNRLTSYGTTVLTYTSNGLIDHRTYQAGDYFRNEYKADSVFLYYKPTSGAETIRAKYTLSATVKNPFLIPGFEKEAFATGILFYYNNANNALLQNIESAIIEYSPAGAETNRDEYTFVLNDKGYPIQRVSGHSTESYSYE